MDKSQSSTVLDAGGQSITGRVCSVQITKQSAHIKLAVDPDILPGLAIGPVEKARRRRYAGARRRLFAEHDRAQGRADSNETHPDACWRRFGVLGRAGVAALETFKVANLPAEVCLRRPFYPNAANKGVTKETLVKGLCGQDFTSAPRIGTFQWVASIPNKKFRLLFASRLKGRTRAGRRPRPRVRARAAAKAPRPPQPRQASSRR